MRDREIVAAIVAGDPAGLAGAYGKYAESLHGYCCWMLGEPDRAAGTVQDTFVIAAASLGGLRDPGRLRPWLYAVARSECRRRLRAGEAGPGEAAALAAPPADAGEDSERAERRGLVRVAMDGLSPGEREVIELGLRHDLSGADLAAVLGVSQSQAHALMSRACGRLERELGVVLVARTGRWACPALDVMLYDWDGQLTAPMRKQVARHIGQCEACAYRRRIALRAAALDGTAQLAALPRGLRDTVLGLCADDSPLAQAYREEVTQRAGPFGANGFPQQVRPPRGRMLALAGGAAASAILVAIVAAGVITVLALGGSRTPRPAGDTRSRSAPATASPAVTERAGAARVSPGVPPAVSQPGTSAPPRVVVPSPSHGVTSSPSAFPSPPPRPSASTSSSCPHPLPHHRCHPLGPNFRATAGGMELESATLENAFIWPAGSRLHATMRLRAWVSPRSVDTSALRRTATPCSRIRHDIGPFGVVQPGESPHDLHTTSIPPAAKTPVISVNEDAAPRLRPRGGRTAMPVLLIAEADLPEEAHAEIADKMTPLLREAKGFICHAGGPDPAGGWRVVEIWESEQDGQDWFDHNIKPNLPPGVMPKQTYYSLRAAVTR